MNLGKIIIMEENKKPRDNSMVFGFASTIITNIWVRELEPHHKMAVPSMCTSSMDYYHQRVLVGFRSPNRPWVYIFFFSPFSSDVRLFMSLSRHNRTSFPYDDIMSSQRNNQE